MISQYRKNAQTRVETRKRLPWQRGRRKALRKLILFPILVLLLLFALKGCYAFKAKRTMAAMRDRGYPIGKACLAKKYPKVPDEENILLPLMKTWATIEPIAAMPWEGLDGDYNWERRYPDQKMPETNIIEYYRRPPWPPEWRDHFEAALTRSGVYFSDPDRMHLDSHCLYYSLIPALFYEIRFLIETEEKDRALKLLDETLIILEKLHRVPAPFRTHALSSWAHHINVTLMVFNTRYPLKRENLRGLMDRLEAFHFFEQAHWELDAYLSFFDEELRCQGFEKELIQAQRAYDEWQRRNGMRRDVRQHRGSFTLGRWFRHTLYSVERFFTDRRSSHKPPPPLLRALVRYFGGADRDLLYAYADYEKASKILSLSPSTACIEADKLEEEQQKRFKSASWFSRQCMAPQGIWHSLWSADARMNCCRTGLAIELYRRDHEEALPESLEELVPIYLDELPKAPQNMADLIYRRHPKLGYVILSPGTRPFEEDDELFDLDTGHLSSRWPQFMILR